ncbi:MAG: hypothetical protein K9G58_13185 [Bacteroidales bacterium]|nr:hypothetical protein [Bacteroidales bacterium]MCF8399123.1 hypothetical protein [Bacteroidales bacterium]
MNWLIIIPVYIFLVALIVAEARSRQIGFWTALIISILLTPILGAVGVFLSRKKITFHHYKKLKEEEIINGSAAKKLQTDGKDHWVEIKTSVLN